MLDAAVAGGLAWLAALVCGPFVIGLLKRLKAGQNIQKELPGAFQAKQGTPIMGGLIMLMAVAVGALAVGSRHPSVVWCLMTTLGYGLIGLVDDWIIVATRRPQGLKARHKLAAQLVLALVLCLYAYNDPALGGSVMVPWGSGSIDLGPLFVPLVAVFVVVGASNGVNLTDGMDGLAAGTSAIAALGFTVIAVIGGFPGVAVFAGALAGACLGFMWFNSHPAQVFMGDTGSLALGAGLASIAVLTRTEFFLALIGGIFVAQIITDTIQVSWYRLKGRRVFRMAPLHYHFHLGGMSETKVVFRFWTAGIVLAVAGVWAFAAMV